MDHNYQSQQGRPPTRRRALAETSSRGNEVPQAQRRGDKLSRDQMPSSSPQPLPHNESLVPNGSLAVRHEQQPSPENKRLSAVQAHYPAHTATSVTPRFQTPARMLPAPTGDARQALAHGSWAGPSVAAAVRVYASSGTLAQGSTVLRKSSPRLPQKRCAR
ncbi:hypothetical protein JI435_430170 [Parastagonospora nodorum SN15]|uniref:Uncharacterized protein n=1 Tax=Phaeosphaeria nodorum (strain SN15 / ATCC MYA-4574 / FGSC 10173) TaxID=321614 RepID=A0A7U2EY68_PHANO|nr:hypothetical protein JI435_430170 [Parastagonospora nodorum SN15]